MMLTAADKVSLLRNVDIFTHCTAEELASLASIAFEVEEPNGATIFTKDEGSDAMYLVVEGRVRLHKGEQEILLVKEGQAFGTWALVDTQPRLMTAIAIADLRLLKIKRKEFHELSSGRVEISERVCAALARRVRQLLGSESWVLRRGLAPAATF